MYFVTVNRFMPYRIIAFLFRNKLSAQVPRRVANDTQTANPSQVQLVVNIPQFARATEL